MTRRQMLRGAAGFSLALPFLPSLLPRKASGQEPTLPRVPRFFAMATNHGGVSEDAMFPAESLLSQSVNLSGGMAIRHGSLARAVEGANARVSEILAAPADRLSDALVSKMNVLRGLDIPFYIAHHTGGHLGNYARNDGNGGDGQDIQQDHMPTIDQLMAWSSSFYPDLSTIRLRSIVTGSFGRLSYGWSNPSAATGSIQEVPTERNVKSLFQQVFVPNDEPEPEDAPRPLIVDRVIEDYRSLRQSNQRLSSSDRQRLDDHMDRLAELQRKVEARPASGAACNSVREPTGGGDFASDLRLLNDVIVAAFLCGSSRIAVMGVSESRFTNYSGDWHQDVAHQWSSPGPQDLLREVNRAAFREVFVDLAAKLDVEDVPGHTVLDDTLMMWTQESGMETHESRSAPVVTFGSAAGAIRTGIYADYRNRTDKGMLVMYGNKKGYTGLLHNQWLATVLQAMGLPRSEWQNVPKNAPTGYGLPQISAEYAATHVSGVVENASDFLPLLAV